ncbi:MAG: CusA/CzcA family heavy metal efflux RND transporter [endosymbiont of Galathealinum brachiosum]|uniref:CusA/CzcA family heavy metal efflux RND transporter n=1 Tax=endosymbiont of Galathealinum brachiosum TaxID=2200906 RepID=A0A370DBM7_9GAMM|nr:MAG: CusA/CzcA family heavy metal efflux RND transporter [endosymbiont of Galathealinum brachiosum]
MITGIINWSIHNRFMVLLITLIITGWGIYAIKNTPLDAIPDLSDVQVIIKTSFPGQAPRVVEDQVTYPLTTAMLSVPKAENVRGYSFFGDSYVYVIFEDGTDPYWARSRVLEYLNQVTSKLPESARPTLGPDATGVGWVYEYALVDRTGKNDLSQLRSLQDWFLKYELQTVAGVSEVATIGGMVKQYQVVLDPNRLRAYNLPISKIKSAIKRANQEIGGSVIEMAEAEYMVRATGYIDSQQDLREIPLGINENGSPILLKDVAEVRKGPQMRRGIAELDGEGEVVGAVVVMRFGENALTTIKGVKKKLAELEKGLPDGVEIVETYNRSELINRAVNNLNTKLIEEFLVVALVCAVFLFHMRSALVVILSLPVGILGAFIIMHSQGMNANIMSLGGIAIAIGAMVDAAIVMIENMHKHIENEKQGGDEISETRRWQLVSKSASEVGPALFFSLIIITLSFMPVFTLEAQEGKLFSPLAYTKTFAMAVASGLSITLVPVLMGYFIRGHITPENKNPVNRVLMAAYKPFINLVLHSPKTVLSGSFIIVIAGLWPATQLGSEFMPDLDEGDLMYMPTTFPGISIGKAQELLQQTDKLIKTVPEVKSVFGKIGRAETATDPAPLTMIETTVQLKPRDQWREGMTTEKLKRELTNLIKFPGLTNAWVMPIKTRIDMLATGIKTPVGIKVAGADLKIIEEIGKEIEKAVLQVPGTASAYSERVAGGRYVTVDVKRLASARFGLNIADVHDVVSTALGGMKVSESVEGLERYPINLRYPRDMRDSIHMLKNLPMITPSGARITLGEVADIKVDDGPAVIKSENARPNGWTFVDIEGRDLGSYVAEAQRVVAQQVKLPAGYSIAWSGQYEYMVRAKERLSAVVPITLGIIVLLLYMNFRKISEVALIMGTLPMALIGGFWLLYLLGYNLSVAVGVGFIALAGVSVEIGVVMLVYLNQALQKYIDLAKAENRQITEHDLRTAVTEGALLRVRPIMMTVAAIIAGLLPIMLGSGTGSEVMRRIAAPMVGGMVSATILTLVVLPSIFLLMKRKTFF